MHASPYHYSAYGLIIRSNLGLPGLQSKPYNSCPDLTIHFDQDWPEEINNDQKQVLNECTTINNDKWQIGKIQTDSDRKYTFIDFPKIAKLLIDPEVKQVWTNCYDPLIVDDVKVYLIGQILGFILRLRGTLCLHACAVRFHDYAIALLGPSGEGKSTLAAAFTLRGHSILSDDITALMFEDNQYRVEPGYPGLRLSTDSISNLFGQNEKFIRLSPNAEKYYMDLSQPGNQFCHQSLPLLAIYVLDPDNETHSPGVHEYNEKDSLLKLLANTYPNYNYSLDKSIRGKEFNQLTQLIQNVAIFRITYKQNFQDLPALCDSLDNHIKNLVQSEKRLPLLSNSVVA